MTVLPDFEAWAVFARVADLRSFSAAAVEMDMSPGTVSKIIGRLEIEVGSTLFHRSTRKLSITPSGAALMKRASALLEAAQDLQREARHEGTGLTGVVRVAAPLTFGLSHLAPALPAFIARHPGITIDVQVDDQPTDLVDGGYDIALRIGRLKDSLLKARKLADNRTMMVAAPAYLERKGTPRIPTDLEKHACFGFSSMPPADTWHMVGPGGQERRIRHSGPFVTNNGALMMPLLLAGNGIAFVPEFFVAAEIAAGRLVHVLPEWAMPPTALYLVMPASGPRPSRVEAVHNFLVERFGGRCLTDGPVRAAA